MTKLDRLLELQSMEDTGLPRRLLEEEIFEKEQLKAELEKAEEVFKIVSEGIIRTEESGVKNRIGMCIYNPTNDLWILDSMQNLLNFQKLQQNETIVQRLQRAIIEKQIELESIEKTKGGSKSCGSDYHAQILNERNRLQNILIGDKE